MSRVTRYCILAGIGLALAGCSSYSPRTTGSRPVQGGGYYLDDGPGDRPPADLAAIPDAVPKAEPLKAAANRPYSALGKDYTPLASAKDYSGQGLASWYGRRYHGKPTSSGELYDMYAMTAAHPTLPIPSYVRVSNPKNGHAVTVRVNDRGPFHDGRIIDLSYTAAWKLDILKGVSPVIVTGIDPGAPPPAPVATPAPIQSETVATTALAPLAPSSAAGAEPAATGATYLQLGAFTDGAGADRVMQRVQERIGAGLPALRRLQVGATVKVQMGPFASLAEADQAAQQVERETGIHGFKVTR